MWHLLSWALLAGCMLLALSGCGYTVSSKAGGGTGSLIISKNVVQFGVVRVGQTAAATVTATNSGSSTVQIDNIDVSGRGFSASGNSQLPVLLKRGDSYTATVQFGPTDTGTLTGTLSVKEPSKTEKVALVGTGTMTQPAGALSGLSCSQNAMSGAGTDTCTVGLNAAAGDSGLTVALSSNNAAISVPSAVTVAAGATTADFSATVAAVSSSSTVTLTASAENVTQSYAIDLSAGQVSAGAPISPAPAGALSGLSCSQNAMTGAGTDFCTVGLTGAAGPGGLTVALSSNNAAISVPSAVTVAAGAAGAGFSATVAAVTSSSTVTLTASAGGVTQSYAINVSAGQVSAGAPISPAAAGALSGLSCSQNAMTGAGTDFCTVGLTGAAGSGGLTVALSSNNPAISVPGAVTVAAGAVIAGFSATVAAVPFPSTVALTASAGSVTKSFSIDLSAGTPALTLQSTSVAFGDVTLNSPATQAVVLASSGTAAVTISAASLSGDPGFSITGTSFPLTIPAGQTATLYLQFKPTSAGAVTGGATLKTNTSAGNVTISLSGTGQASNSYQVALTWNAPADTQDPVASYKIYRAVGGSSSYQPVGSSSDTTYNDTSISSGTAYTYYVESVDASGNQSAPSNTFTISIP